MRIELLHMSYHYTTIVNAVDVCETIIEEISRQRTIATTNHQHTNTRSRSGCSLVVCVAMIVTMTIRICCLLCFYSKMRKQLSSELTIAEIPIILLIDSITMIPVTLNTNI